ncbi:dihydroxyacetone kinase subunit DhaL [Nocardia sp. NPDC058497]|uniref:dihydroxyacetone kinase subunit DhaL n=1 Tax=Nocardia sp. NPDC058497 TaxID=3346529 RepID=UPI0036588BAD
MTTIDATRWLRAFAALIDEHVDELTALDAAIGDADHGSNMRRGTAAVVVALDDDPQPTAGAVLKQTGMVLIRSVGGASGPLYGTFFLRCATATGDGELDGPTFAAAFRAGLDGVVARGKAESGDKTMVDALVPAADALDEQLAAGADLAVALDAALAAASTGRDATIPLVARKGRASYLGERSAGHQDPGATSATLLVAAAGNALR